MAKSKMVSRITEEALPLGAGAIGQRLIKKAASGFVKDARLLAAVPVVLGVILMEQKSKFLEYAGMGITAAGIADLAGAFIPALNGIEDMDLSGVFGNSDSLNSPIEGDEDVSGPLNGPAYDENY